MTTNSRLAGVCVAAGIPSFIFGRPVNPDINLRTLELRLATTLEAVLGAVYEDSGRSITAVDAAIKSLGMHRPLPATQARSDASQAATQQATGDNELGKVTTRLQEEFEKGSADAGVQEASEVLDSREVKDEAPEPKEASILPTDAGEAEGEELKDDINDDVVAKRLLGEFESGSADSGVQEASEVLGSGEVKDEAPEEAAIPLTDVDEGEVLDSSKIKDEAPEESFVSPTGVGEVEDEKLKVEELKGEESKDEDLKDDIDDDTAADDFSDSVPTNAELLMARLSRRSQILQSRRQRMSKKQARRKVQKIATRPKKIPADDQKADEK